MATLVGYIALFLGAGVFGVAAGVPMTPLQILWLNMVIDVPIAIALGFDSASSSLMARAPRPLGTPVLSTGNWVRLTAQGLLMAVGSLVVYALAEAAEGTATAATMLLTTLSLFHVVAGYMARDQERTVFDRDSLPGSTQLRRYGFALAAVVLATELGLLQRILETVPLERAEWAICVGVALTMVVAEELIKVTVRRRESTTTMPAVA
jgi:Ca2+-transporting ATPase